jgi:hypothetical protein
VTGAPASIVVEPRRGGRIFERDAEGTEHEWGSVTRWDPPNGLSYSWHLGREREHATEVEIRFLPETEGTRVEIEHRGWDTLGGADEWRDRTRTNWMSLFPHFTRCAEGDAH